VTKVLGAQSLDDHILELNKRPLPGGYPPGGWITAGAGFKIVPHWMPNLLGATLDSDQEDFLHLWESLCPDEPKIYPTCCWRMLNCTSTWRGEYSPHTPGNGRAAG
jgi:elongator complex protein 3